MANVTGSLAPDKNFERVANTPGAWEGIARTLRMANS
jgi:hypothetical protein